jgi:hypothetical protein
MFAQITKVNEGESNTPCPSTLEVTYSSVEKLSKVLNLACAMTQKMHRNHGMTSNLICAFFSHKYGPEHNITHT